MNWSQLITNVIAAGGGTAGIVSLVPARYQPYAALALAVISNLAGLFQQQPHKS